MGLNKKRNSIRNHLIIGLINFVLIPLLVILIIIIMDGFGKHREYVMYHQKVVTEMVSHEASLFLHEPENRLQSMLNLNYFPEMSDKQHSDILLTFLFSSKNNRNEHIFQNITLLDENGRVKVFHDRIQPSAHLNNEDKSDSDDFLIPFRTGKTYYSPVYKDESTQKSLMKIAVPIKDIRTQVFKGVIEGEINLMPMTELISDIGIDQKGIAYIVDQDGRVIIHPNPSVVNRNTHIKVPEKSSTMKGINGKKSFIEVASIEYNGPSLSIVTEIPSLEVYRYIYHALFIIGITILIPLIIQKVRKFPFIRKLVIPIESMAETAKKISRGDLSQKVEPCEINELNELTSSFNNMISRLAETISSFKSEKNFLRSAINALSHPFYVVDVKDYTIKLANTASNFGMITAESKCYYLTHGYDRPCHENQFPCPINEIKKTRKSVIVRHAHGYGNRPKKIFEIHASPIFNDQGDVVQIIEYPINITEKERLLGQTKVQEEQLIRADKLASLGTFAAGIAHEINNPNQAILHSGFFLQESWVTIKSILDKYYKERGDFLIGGLNYSDFRDLAGNCYGTIPERARHIANIVEELKRFSLPDQKTVHEKIDLSKVIDSAVEFISLITLESTIEISVNPVPTLPILKGDHRRLEQVLINLLHNSWQARRDDKINISISTSWYESDHQIGIEIKDNGVGISPANLLRLTDPFFTTKRTEGGTGLGLAVSAIIIRDHNGILEFESVEGEGTTARIILPVETISKPD